MPDKEFRSNDREIAMQALVGSGLIKDPSLPPWRSMTASELAEVHERLTEELQANQQMSGLGAEETTVRTPAGQEGVICAIVHEVNGESSQDPEYVILVTNGAIKWKLRRRLSEFCKVALATQVPLCCAELHRASM